MTVRQHRATRARRRLRTISACCVTLHCNVIKRPLIWQSGGRSRPAFNQPAWVNALDAITRGESQSANRMAWTDDLDEWPIDKGRCTPDSPKISVSGVFITKNAMESPESSGWVATAAGFSCAVVENDSCFRLTTPETDKPTYVPYSPNPGRMTPPKPSRSLLDEIRWKCVLMLAHLQLALGSYVLVMRSARPQDDPYLRPWKAARDGTWLLLLVLAYLQYYFMDVHAQIAALPALNVRV
jgi:hypothetical protein